MTFINCALFINCISEINNTQEDDAHDIDVVMPPYSLIEYSNSYLETSGRLWQYYIDQAVLQDNNVVIDFPADNDNSTSFKSKQQLTGQTENNGKKDVEKMVSLKYRSTGQTGNNRKKLLK